MTRPKIIALLMLLPLMLVARAPQAASYACKPEEIAKESAGGTLMFGKLGPPGIITASIGFTSISLPTTITWGIADAAGTSGCGDGTAMIRDSLRFVADNRGVLEQALAQGGGEALDAAGELLGVPEHRLDAFAAQA